MAQGQDTGNHPGRKVDRETHRQAQLDDLADAVSNSLSTSLWGKKPRGKSTKTGAQLDRDKAGEW